MGDSLCLRTPPAPRPSWLGRYPDQNLSIALLCNAGDVDANSVAERVADRFLPDQALRDAITFSASRPQLLAFVG
jgi:hypothetical protein